MKIKAIGFLTFVFYIALFFFVAEQAKVIALALAAILFLERTYAASVIIYLKSATIDLSSALLVIVKNFTGVRTDEEARDEIRRMLLEAEE